MKQLFIGAILCVFVCTACDTGSTGSIPIDGISNPNSGGALVDPTIVPTVDPWSIAPTTELTIETTGRESVYLVETWRDIEYISSHFETNTDLLTSTYRVIKNIRFPDLESTVPEDMQNTPYVINNGLIPIGNSSNPFTGTFDGSYEGYTFTIYDLMINKENIDNVGFFGVMGSNSSVSGYLKNIQLENISIEGSHHVGGLVGHVIGSNNSIENSYAYGSISGKGSYIGGLIGYMNSNAVGTISNNHTSGSVEASLNYAGGLIGGMESSASITIENSYSDSTVTAVNSSGGLIGEIKDSTAVIVSSNYATGNVIASSSKAGGLVGSISMTSENIFIDNYATGNITTLDSSGGLIGFIDTTGASLKRNYAAGIINGNPSNYGGLLGELTPNANPVILNNYWNDGVQTLFNTYGIGSLGKNDGAVPLQSPQQSNFETWDFDGEDAVWVWNEGSWPTLYWQEEN